MFVNIRIDRFWKVGNLLRVLTHLSVVLGRNCYLGRIRILGVILYVYLLKFC